MPSSDYPQLSDEWFALHKDKLTTSTFSTALGMWKGNRRSELWHAKVFPSNTQITERSKKGAQEWGVLNEVAAIERYKSITGQDVSSLGYAIHSEERLDWIGASPDGLLGCCGVLEVKCPFNKGKLGVITCNFARVLVGECLFLQKKPFCWEGRKKQNH